MMDAFHAVAGIDGHFLCVTHNGGQSWQTFYEGPKLGGNINSVFFHDEAKGWISGNRGMLLRFDGDITGLDSHDDYFRYKQKKMLFYPNPANEMIHLLHEGLNFVRIYDISGNLLFDSPASSSKTIDISFLKKGVYLVVANTADQTVSQKLIKH